MNYNNIEEFNLKIEKIRKCLKTKNLNAVVINSQMNFSWLCAGRGFIGLASEFACASFVITDDRVILVANNIEANRLKDEELTELRKQFDLLIYPWYESCERERLLSQILSEKEYANDTELKEEFTQLRSSLTKMEISRYRILGNMVAITIEELCFKLNKGMTEFQVAGNLSSRLWEQGIEPVTNLIAFDERIFKYRHPLPTMNSLKKHAIISVSARKWGLYVSATRCVYMGKLPDEIREKHNAVVQIDAALINGTRPGKLIHSVFEQALQIYKEKGFTEEWRLHHQGGRTGYMARECLGNLGNNTEVQLNQAYAWNPTINGTKSEDTILVLDDRNEIITHTGKFPCKEVEYNDCRIMRPEILIL